MALLTKPRCEVCGRTLTNPTSIAAGFGDECAARRAGFYGAAGIEASLVDTLMSSGERDAQRWLTSLRGALRHGDIYMARRFFGRALGVAGQTDLARQFLTD